MKRWLIGVSLALVAASVTAQDVSALIVEQHPFDAITSVVTVSDAGMSPVQATILLVIGAVLGAAFVLTAFLRRRRTRPWLVVGLIVVALAYVWFARERPAWLLVELAGVGVYGAVSWAGLRGSPWWIVAAWALHPVWDIVLHYVGPGRAFAPVWYAVPCVSFDLVVAVYVAYRVRDRHAETL